MAIANNIFALGNAGRRAVVRLLLNSDLESEETRRNRSEADLRGALSNDSLSEDEIQQIEADRLKAENAAKLREDDYQLAYAIDILSGLSAISIQN